MQGDRIARFDTKTQKFNEWDLPSGAHPHGLVVDKEGKVWYTGNGNAPSASSIRRAGKSSSTRRLREAVRIRW